MKDFNNGSYQFPSFSHTSKNLFIYEQKCNLGNISQSFVLIFVQRAMLRYGI